MKPRTRTWSGCPCKYQYMDCDHLKACWYKLNYWMQQKGCSMVSPRRPR